MAIHWRSLSSRRAARVREAAAIVPPEVCSALIAAFRPAIDATAPTTEYEALVDYRSVPLHACGSAAIGLVEASGVGAISALATGVPSRPGEDIMVARTRALTSSARGILNMHHDQHHGNDHRVATFMLNLVSVDPAAHGGETYFPLTHAPADDALALTLAASYERGERFWTRSSVLGIECEKRYLHAANKEEHTGVSVAACAGSVLVFDASPDPAAWHAPCLLRTGSEKEHPVEKWTVTWFKAPALATAAWPAALLNGI